MMHAEPELQLRVTHQSFSVIPGGTFVAIQGARDDGARHIPEALERGARTIVAANDAHISDDVLRAVERAGVSLVRVSHVRRALAELSAAAYGYPARDLTILGITGTKGKTTSAFLLFHILRSAGISAALLSTVHNRIGDRILPTELTTQQPDYLHAFFAEARAAGVTHVVMEIAAQAMTMDRVHGLSLSVLAWTNFGREHGEFYAEQDDYFAAKAGLFSLLQSEGLAVLNQDDERIMSIALPSGVRTTTFSKSMVQHVPVDLQNPVVCARVDHVSYACPALFGDHHAVNIAMVVRVAREACGVNTEAIQNALRTFVGVPGRCQLISLPDRGVACIDYAHTPASVEAVLRELRHYTPHLVTVMGCGGDRDRAKRPIMASLAAQLSDIFIIATDNPRSEDPAAICAEMYRGVMAEDARRVFIELDRRRAIERAYASLKPGSVLALLGKGPDEYQIFGNVKEYFSERTILRELAG